MEDSDAVNSLFQCSYDGFHLKEVSECSSTSDIMLSFSKLIGSLPLLDSLTAELSAYNAEALALKKWTTLYSSSLKTIVEGTISPANSSQAFISKLIQIVREVDGETISDCVCKAVKSLCMAVELASNRETCCRVIAEGIAIGILTHLPLFIINILDSQNIMNTSSYIRHLWKCGRISIVKSQVFNILARGSNTDPDSRMYSDCLCLFLSRVVSICYSSPQSLSPDEFAGALSKFVREEIILQFLRHEFGKIFETGNGGSKFCDVFVHIRQNCPGIISLFLSDCTQAILEGVLPTSQEILQHLSEITRLTFKDISVVAKQVLSEILCVVDLNTILRQIRQVIESSNVNVRNLLMFNAILIAAFNEQIELFVEFLCSSFCESLKAANESQALLCLLCIRHSVTCDRVSFPPYASWILKINTLLTETTIEKSCLLCYCQMLTSLLPFENVEFLRCHISMFPTVNRKYQVIADDYLSLARSTLSELKVTQRQTTGLSQTTREPIQCRDELEKALAYFETHGKIPKSLIEMSVFKKTYFEKVFLPALLRPVNVSSTTDMKYNFAQALQEAGKIPKNIWVQFLASCEHLTFMESLKMSSMEAADMILKKVKEIDNILFSAKGVNATGNKHWTAETFISSLECYLEEFEKKLYDKEGATMCIVEICDGLLNGHCRAMMKFLSAGNTLNVSSLKWFFKVMMVIQKFDRLWEEFTRRVHDLVTDKMSSLELYHIYTLASICYFCEVARLKFPSCKASTLSIQEMTQRCSSLSWNEQLFMLSFMSVYLLLMCSDEKEILVVSEEAFNLEDSSTFMVQVHSLKLFRFLMERLHRILAMTDADPTFMRDDSGIIMMKANDSVALTKSVCEHPRISGVVSACHVAFSEWVELELNVSANEDFCPFSKKEIFYERCLWQFMERNSCTVKPVLDVYIKDIFVGLVNFNSRHTHVPSACDLCSSVYHAVGSSYEMLDFLRSLIERSYCMWRILQPNSSHSYNDTDSWLLTYLNEKISLREEQEHAQFCREELESIFFVCRKLPPWLLLGRQNSYPNLKGSLQTLTGIVNNLWTIRSPRTLLLPSRIVEFFVRSLTACFDLSNTQSDIQQDVVDFLKNCPFLLTSIATSEQIWPWLLSPEQGSCIASPFFKFLADFQKTVQCYNFKALQNELDGRILAIVIFTAVQDDFIKVSEYLRQHRDIAIACLECCFLTWTHDFIFNDVDFACCCHAVKLGSFLVGDFPECFTSLSAVISDQHSNIGLGNMRQSMAHSRAIELYPLAMVRILNATTRPCLEKLSKWRPFITSLQQVLASAHQVINNSGLNLIFTDVFRTLRQLELLTVISQT